MEKKSKKYLYIPKEGSIKVRFVGHQEQMFQYFNNAYFNNSTTSSSFSFNLNNPSSYSLENLTSPEKNIFFREDDNGDEAYSRAKRVVSLVIDREDDIVKAFACPISVWNQIVEHPKDNDFRISRTGSGLNTRYQVHSIGISEVSKSKEKSIEATLDRYTFADIFIKKEWKVLDEIIERIEHRWQILDL